MATLNSDAAQRKWDELSKTESATIERIVSGNATQADYTRMSDILRQYSTIARDVFHRGIQLIEREAAKEAQDRIYREGLAPDSPEAEEIHRQASQEVYEEQAPALLDAIKELVEESDRPEDTQDSFGQSEDDDTPHYVWDKDADTNDRDESDSTAYVYQRDPDPAETDTSTSHIEDPVPVFIDSVSEDALDAFDNEERKRKWASDWWNNFKHYVGSRAKRSSGLLKELALLAAATYAFSPKIRDWVNSKIDSVSKYFTTDYLKEVLSDVWGYIKEQGTIIINWILEKLKQAGNWVTGKVDDVVEFATDTYKGAKEWTVEQFSNISTARNQHHVNVYKANIEKHEKRLAELKAQRDGTSDKPLSPKQKLQLDERIRVTEIAIENAKKNQDYHQQKIEEIEREIKVDQSSDGTTSTSVGGPPPAAAPAATVASMPSVSIDDAAEPPVATPATGSGRGDSSGQPHQELAPNLDSFSYTPQVDDRLLLANLLT